MREVGHKLNAEKVSFWNVDVCLLLFSSFVIISFVVFYSEAGLVLILRMIGLVIDANWSPWNGDFDKIDDIFLEDKLRVSCDYDGYLMGDWDDGGFNLNE